MSFINSFREVDFVTSCVSQSSVLSLVIFVESFAFLSSSASFSPLRFLTYLIFQLLFLLFNHLQFTSKDSSSFIFLVTAHPSFFLFIDSFFTRSSYSLQTPLILHSTQTHLLVIYFPSQIQHSIHSFLHTHCSFSFSLLFYLAESLSLTHFFHKLNFQSLILTTNSSAFTHVPHVFNIHSFCQYIHSSVFILTLNTHSHS